MNRPEKACPVCRQPFFGLDSQDRWRCLICEPLEPKLAPERLAIVYDEELIAERQYWHRHHLTSPPGVAPPKPLSLPFLRELRGELESERLVLQYKAQAEGCEAAVGEELAMAMNQVAMAAYAGDPDEAVRLADHARDSFCRARRLAFLRDQQDGRKARRNQSQRAQKERSPISGILDELATREEGLEYAPPSSLWWELFRRLEDADLEPEEEDGQLLYGEGQKITYEAFRRHIQRARST